MRWGWRLRAARQEAISGRATRQNVAPLPVADASPVEPRPVVVISPFVADSLYVEISNGPARSPETTIRPALR